MPDFRIEAPGATPTIVEAQDWEVAVARYVKLRDFTGWSGDTPLTVAELVEIPAGPNGEELLFSEELFRIAMNMLSAGAQLATEVLRLPNPYGAFGPDPRTGEVSRERLIEALMEFSALKLRDAREPTAGLSTRVAAAFDSGYAALLAIAGRHSLPDHEKHPNAKALTAAAAAGGLKDQDVMLGLRLLRWVVAEQYVEPSTLPASLPTAIEWAERVRALLSS